MGSRVAPTPRGKCAKQSNYGYDVAEGRRGREPTPYGRSLVVARGGGWAGHRPLRFSVRGRGAQETDTRTQGMPGGGWSAGFPPLRGELCHARVTTAKTWQKDERAREHTPGRIDPSCSPSPSVGAIPRGRPRRRRGGAPSPSLQRKGTRSPRDRHKNAGDARGGWAAGLPPPRGEMCHAEQLRLRRGRRTNGARTYSIWAIPHPRNAPKPTTKSKPIIPIMPIPVQLRHVLRPGYIVERRSNQRLSLIDSQATSHPQPPNPRRPHLHNQPTRDYPIVYSH